MNGSERKLRINQRRHSWIKNIQAGDVLKSGSGLLRVVRKVTHSKTRCSVTFTIKHCSWTGRCYTTMSSSDLITFGYVSTGKKYPLTATMVDREIAYCIANHDIKDQTLKCCDVEGVG
jgi:hypothetical protein